VKRKISIFGATGSVGSQALSVIDESADDVEMVALTANGSLEKLAALAEKYSPQCVVTADASKYNALKDAVAHLGVDVKAGEDGLLEAATMAADWSVMSIMGATALPVTVKLIEQGASLALANKESIICGGRWILDKFAQHNCTLLPLDSEHNALFQLLHSERLSDLKKLMITASGGPFRTKSLEELHNVTPAEAANHPVWPMGQKISIDSATLVNKGLEVIEAAYLFETTPENIDVLIHPQSLIHAMVTFGDGSSLAHFACPDMRIPIAHAYTYPNRCDISHKEFDVTDLNRMEFFPVDSDRFPAVDLAKQALRQGQVGTITYNAANEVAVQAFVDGVIPFTDIVTVLEKSLSQAVQKDITSMNEIIEVDAHARELAKKHLPSLSTAA